MKLKPLCVVQTEDQAIKFFGAHDPIPATGGGHVTLNLQLESQTVSLRLCKRCGVAYVETHSVTFAEPTFDGVISPHGGNA